jgi:hypothetical protein
VSTPYAHEFTSSVSISGSSVAIAYEGKTFTSIRYTGITQGGAPPPTTDAGAPTPTPPTAPPPSSPPSSPSGCYSSTLGRDMPANACVQSESNDDWYQCDDGEWVDRWDDPTACSGVYPR